MRLQRIRAVAHPAGNRIDLYWEFPKSPDFPRVHIVRREGTHPTLLQEGVRVTPGLLFDLELSFQDDLDNAAVSTGLKQRFLENEILLADVAMISTICLLYTSPSPRDRQKSRMPSSA